MHVNRFHAFTVLAALLLWAAPPASAQDNPFVGVWVLDVEHSMYQVADAPDWRIVEIEPAADDQLTYTSHSFYPNERSALREVTYTAALDGTPAVVPQSGAQVSLMPMGEGMLEVHAMARNNAESTQHWELSDGNDMLTIVAEGQDAFGNAYKNELHYTRGTEHDLEMHMGG